MDERDIKSNELGVKFGRALLIDPKERPSNYLGSSLK
jgi:hypothetical protein